LKIVDINHSDKTLPFLLNNFKLQTSQTLIESNEYEFEIHYSTPQSQYRQRLHTVFIIRINISPFHF